MSRNYTLADAATVLRAADDDYHDGIDAIVDIHTQPTHQAGAAELLVQLTPPAQERGAGVQRFRVTITPDPTPVPEPPAPGEPTVPVRAADLLDGCADHAVAAARAALVIADSYGGWGPLARRLLAVLLQAAALDGRDLHQVKAWTSDLTPAVIGQIDAILTTRTPTGTGADTEAVLADQRAVLLRQRDTHARVQDSVTTTITAALTSLDTVTTGGQRP